MKTHASSARPGFTLVELLSVILVISVLASIAMPNLFASRKRANETSAIAAMREISRGEEIFRIRHTQPSYATMDELAAAGLVSEPVIAGMRSGYSFSITVTSSSSFTAVATPSMSAGDRSFFVDESGVIRAEDDGAASVSSQPINFY